MAVVSTVRRAVPARLSSLVTDRSLLLGVAALGLLLRLAWLTRQGLWTDELYMAWQARQPLDLIFDPHIHIQHPPGYRLLMHMWMGIGTGEAWIRLLPALAGALTVVVVRALARALWPSHPRAAVAAAFLVATSPYLVHYGQDITAYSWASLCVAASALLLVCAWQSDRRWLWAGWGLSLAICLYSHYFTIFPVLAEVAALIALALSRRGDALPRLRHALAAVAGAGLLYAPWVWVLLARGGDALGQVFYPLTIDSQPLRWVPALVAGYPNASFWQTGPGAIAIWMALLAALGWGLWRLWLLRSGSDRLGAGLVGLLAVSAILGPYFFLRLTTPPDAVDPVRFAAMAAPLLLLGLGVVMASIPPTWRVTVLAVWSVFAGVQLYAHYTAPPAQDWRGMMGVLASQAKEGDALLAFPAFHAGAAAAYYQEPLPVQGGWFVSDRGQPAAAAYWFPQGWQWRAFFDTKAYRSTDLAREIATRSSGATRLWYLGGDGVDGTYPPSPAAERALSSQGWQEAQEWHVSPLVLRLYVRP